MNRWLLLTIFTVAASAVLAVLPIAARAIAWLLGTERTGQFMGCKLEALGGGVAWRSRGFTLPIIIALLAMLFASEVRADPPRPEGTVYAYVSALQGGNIPALQALLEPQLYQNTLAQTSGTGVYPVVRSLGPIGNIQVSAVQLDPAGQTYWFQATVSHERGISRWTFFVAVADLRIRQTNLEFVSLTPVNPPSPIPSPVPGPIPGLGPNNPIHGGIIYGDIFGSRPFRNPDAGGQIASAFPNWGDQPTPSPSLPPPPRPSAPPPVQYSNPCQTTPGACGSGTSGQLNDRRLVEFLFATDRVPKNGTTAVEFTGDRQANLTFGAAAIHIPEHHRIGRTELPSVWKFWGIELRREQQDDTKHFALRKLSIMPIENWEQLVRGKNAKSALVFVHGFANTFEDAMFRNAQMVYDLDYQGLSVLYSWSSRGELQDYRYDLDSALAARDGFIFILKKLKDLGIEHVDVLAHSMGNLVVIDALKNNAGSASPVQLDQLIMAAPDVDRGTFERQLPDVQKIIQGATLYASGADKALMASKVLAIYPRAGDVPTGVGPVVLPNLDTIDVTEIGDELLGLNHAEFATNRAVMDDLKILLDSRGKSPRLGEIRGFPEPPLARAYWRYVP